MKETETGKQRDTKKYWDVLDTFIAWNLAMIIISKLINLYILNMCISL